MRSDRAVCASATGGRIMSLPFSSFSNRNYVWLENYWREFDAISHMVMHFLGSINKVKVSIFDIHLWPSDLSVFCILVAASKPAARRFVLSELERGINIRPIIIISHVLLLYLREVVYYVFQAIAGEAGESVAGECRWSIQLLSDWWMSFRQHCYRVTDNSISWSYIGVTSTSFSFTDIQGGPRNCTFSFAWC